MKTIVTVITDLHLISSNTVIKKNALESQDNILNTLKDIIEQRSLQCDKHIVIFLGDMSNTLTDKALMRIIVWLRDIALISKIYGVIGNHEITYGKNGNIYMHLAYGDKQIEKNSVEKIDKIIEVKDYVDIDDTRLLFWHYGRNIEYGDITDINNLIVLGHNNIAVKDLDDYYKSNNIDTLSKYIKRTDIMKLNIDYTKLRAMYLGHAHNLVGKYRIDDKVLNYEFLLYQLGSLQLPKHNEYDIEPTRFIPFILIDKGEITFSEDRIKLFEDKYDEINLNIVSDNQEKYNRDKERKKLKGIEYEFENPIDIILEHYSGDVQTTIILKNCIDNIKDDVVEKFDEFISRCE